MPLLLKVIIPGLFEPPVRALRFFRKYPFSAFKHCHAYSIIIVVFYRRLLDDEIRQYAVFK